MVYDYLITLKKADNPLIDLISSLMLFFALIVFGYGLYNNSADRSVYFIIPAIVFFSTLSLIRKRKTGKAFFRMGLIVAAVGWLLISNNIWMALLYVLAALFEKQVKFPQEIGFSTSNIVFNSFPKRRIFWQDVSNAVIKDGLLTIDQSNNKLFQKEIEGYVTADIEKEFNSFCRHCIARASAK